MRASSSSAPDEALFGLGDGRLSRFATLARIARERRLLPGRAALLAACVAWVPLLLLTWAHGDALAASAGISFLEDFLPHARYLFALPLLIVAEQPVGARLTFADAHLRQAGIVQAASSAELESVLRALVGIWRRPLTQTVLLVLAYALPVLALTGAAVAGRAGWQNAGSALTPAGLWNALVSAPLLAFVMYRWLLRLGLWAWFLWRVARMDLRLAPGHPDRAGGLAFLGSAQSSFAALVLAFSAQFASVLADAVYHQGADLTRFKPHVAVFAILMLALVLTPLLPFSRPMSKARMLAEAEASRWAGRSAARLAEKLRGSAEADTEDGSLDADISGLADFGALFENIRTMRPLPIEPRHAVIVLVAALLPCSPLLLLVMPASDVVRKLAGILL